MKDISAIKPELGSESSETFEKVHIQRKPVYEFTKRVFDFTVALIAMIVLFIPLLIVALIIVIDSPGASPIYVQTTFLNGKNAFYPNTLVFG